MVARFHGAAILLERFDRENVRPRVETKASHPPREFAVVTSYLRTLAHIRTLIEFTNASHFQAAAMSARAIFELAVEIRLIDKIEDGPDLYQAFSDVERLRVARRIVAFHHVTNEPNDETSLDPPIEPLQPAWVHAKFIEEHKTRIDTIAQKYWPKHFEKNKTVFHWSTRDLRQRAILLGAPFHEVYDLEYAELSWYTHPGVGVVATLDKEMYPLICGKAFGIAARCYRETLLFMIQELRIASEDPLIQNKLEFARLAAFCDDQQQADKLRLHLLGF